MQVQRIQNNNYNPNFKQLIVIDENADYCLKRDLSKSKYDEFRSMVKNINSTTKDNNVIIINREPYKYHGEIYKNGIGHLLVYERCKHFYESIPRFVKNLVAKSKKY